VAHPVDDHADFAVGNLQRHEERGVLEAVADGARREPPQVELANEPLQQPAPARAQVSLWPKFWDMEAGAQRKRRASVEAGGEHVPVHLQQQVMVQVPLAGEPCERLVRGGDVVHFVGVLVRGAVELGFG